MYFPDSERVGTFLALKPPEPAIRWEDAARQWIALKGIDPRGRDELEDALLAAWRAALESIALDRPSDLAGLKVEEIPRS